MFEKEAEEYTKKNFCGCCPLTWKNQCKDFVNCGYHDSWKNGAEFGYNKSKAETALLSQHILDLQKDKGNLTDRVRELEQQIEKMKNCKNCKKLKKEKDGLLVCTVGSFYTNAFGKNCDKWEIKENE